MADLQLLDLRLDLCELNPLNGLLFFSPLDLINYLLMPRQLSLQFLYPPEPFSPLLLLRARTYQGLYALPSMMLVEYEN